MKKGISIIFFLTFFISGLNAQLNLDWKWLHQSPQGNDLKWVKMWDASTIYAIGFRGTFIKTTNGGQDWIIQHKTGRVAGIPVQVSDLRNAWFFNKDTGLVVGTYGSIFRTTNGGLTFDSTNNPAPSNTTITGISFINNLTGYTVSGLTNYRLMKTTDGGQNWIANYGSAPPYSNPYDIYAFSENKLMVLSGLGDLYITTNGGYLWNNYTTGSQVAFYKAVFINSDTGFICGDWGRCRYTTNGGYNWTSIAGTMLSQNNHFFDVKYRNGTVWLTGNSKYLWRTTNLGVTWDSINFMAPSATPLWSNSYYSSDFSATGDTIVTVGANGSIHQSKGLGNYITLSQYLKTGSLRDISVSETGTIIAAGSPSTAGLTHDQILRSSNGGINWSVISPSTTSAADFYSVEMIDENTGYICGSRSAVYRTTNGGLNWDSLVIQNMPAGLVLTKVDFVNAQTGWIFSRYLTGNDSTIYRTTNGGVNWFKQKFGTAAGTENTINSACMIDANNGWLLSNKPRPWKTTNGGASWDSTGLSDDYLAGALYKIKMLNMQTGYCVGSNNKVYKTTNGGSTPWISTGYSSSTVVTLYTAEVFNSLEAVVMGTYGTVYHTTNGGVNWINKNLYGSINDVYGSFLTGDGKLYAVTLLNSNIFKNQNMFSVGVKSIGKEIPKTYLLEQNFPNPFNPVTKIRFSVPVLANGKTRPGSGVTALKIFDITGKEVDILVNEKLNPGIYEVNFNASKYSSGVYFYSLTSDGFSQTRKMVLLK